MPCIGILGVKVRLTCCSTEFQNIIFHPNIEVTTPHSELFNPDLKLSEYYHNNKFSSNNCPLKIYNIEYSGMRYNLYINSYNDLLSDYIYITKDIIYSDSYSHCDNILPLQYGDTKIDYSEFYKWVDSIKNSGIYVYEVGFFVVEE